MLNWVPWLNTRLVVSAASGLLAFLIHVPFAFRWDLFFQADCAVGYLVMKRMLVGEFPIYRWSLDYCGLGPVELITAGLFAIFGASVPVACLVALGAWSAVAQLTFSETGAQRLRRQIEIWAASRDVSSCSTARMKTWAVRSSASGRLPTRA